MKIRRPGPGCASLCFKGAFFRSRVDIRKRKRKGSSTGITIDWEEPVATAPSHRILAMRRGEKEGFLTLRVIPPEEEALALLEAPVRQGRGPGRRAGPDGGP